MPLAVSRHRSSLSGATMSSDSWIVNEEELAS